MSKARQLLVESRRGRSNLPSLFHGDRTVQRAMRRTQRRRVVHCLKDADIRGDKQMLKSIIDEKKAGPQFKEGIWKAATFNVVSSIIKDLLNPVPNCRVSAVLLLKRSFFSEKVPDVRGAANLDDASMRKLNAATAPDDLIESQVVNRPPEEDAS